MAIPLGCLTCPHRQSLVEENFHLRAKLETLPVIEQAKGIIMAKTGVTADQAFSWLRRISNDSNIKLRDVAQDLIDKTVFNK